MDRLIFTPRRADFLKDGSIFAQSPANTSNTATKPQVATADCNRSQPEAAPASASRAPVLHAPQPQLPTSDGHANLVWAPIALASPQVPSFGQHDMAKQIRAKFENLVRASPLPKVVERLMSPQVMQQTKWSGRFSRDASGPPSWHARQTPASIQSAAGTSRADKPVIAHSGHNTTSAAEAAALPGLQVSLEARLCNTADQSSSQSGGLTDSRLLLGQPTMSADAVLEAPEQPQLMRLTLPGQCTASDEAEEQNQAGLPTTQESAQQQPTASGPAAGAHQPSSHATVTPAHDSGNVSPVNGHTELAQQAQHDQQCMSYPADTAVDAGAGPHVTQLGQAEYRADAAQRQDSSSMVSLSPSLKLDIPGLDDILSSDILTEDDGQATSQLQLHQQHKFQHDQPGSHDLQQQQQQQQSINQQATKADGQQEVAQRSAYPAGPEASGGTPKDCDALQSSPHVLDPSKFSSRGGAANSEAGAGVTTGHPIPTHPHLHSATKPSHRTSRATPLEEFVADDALAARQHSLMPGSQGAVMQNPAGPVASPGPESEEAAEQPDPLLDRANSLAGAPAQPAAARGANDADGSARGGAAVQMHSHTIATHRNPEACMQASPSRPVSSEHEPSADHDSMVPQADRHEPGRLPNTDAGITEQVSAATDLHTEPAATCPEQNATTDEQPQSSQQTSMTNPKQGPQHKRRQASSSNNTGPSSKRRCVVTRSSQGGQVQPLLTAPSDVSWQDKKGVYETSRRGRVRYPPLAFWMHETKVHDKHGGAVAIQRPAPSPRPLTHPKPPPHAGPAPPPRAHSPAQSITLTRQPAASVAHSHAQTKLDTTQAEAQSQMQTEPGLPEMADNVAKGAAKQVQRSRKRRATSPDVAVTQAPRDPPSPPFPYPILAKRAPQASRAAPGLDSVKQAVQKCHPAAHSHLFQHAAGSAEAGKTNAADAAVVGIAAASSKKPSSKGKARRPASTASVDEAAADHGDSARARCSNDLEAGPSDAPPATAAAAVGKGKGKAGADGSKALSKLKRCGTCKNCLQKSAKQGCLVLRAVREAQTQSASAAAHQEPEAAAHPAKAAKPIATGEPTAAVAKTSKAAEAKLRQSLASLKGPAEEEKGSKGNKAKAGNGAGCRQADAPARSSKTVTDGRVGKHGKGVCLHPEGSIHSALTQAVELASDMEQPSATEQQREAAEALESLKNSPVGSAPSQLAVSELLATAPGQTDTALPEVSLGETAAAGGAAEALPAKKGRGRPRKERKPGAEPLPASAGPKRGRGRPRKSPVEPASPDKLPASGGNASLPADAVGAQPESSIAQAVPIKVKLEKGKQKLPPRGKGASGPPSTAPQLNREGSVQQPSTSGRSSSPLAGWTAEQRAALQRAYLTVQPSQRNFWQHVAKQVPGKTALECCNCKFDELPTPVEKVKQTSRLMPGRDSSPIRPPALKLAGGRVKKPSVAATKQWARQVRWQQRAHEQSDNESPQPSHHPAQRSQEQSKLGKPQRGSATSTLLAAIHKQDKADKYIDRILRKQGGRLRKFKAAPGPSIGGHGDRVRQQQGQQATMGVMAELQALGRQEPVDEDVYESEQDHYFSDDDA